VVRMRVARVVSTLLLLVLVAPFVWSLSTGDSFMQVTSGSMEPTYQVGDVIAVRPTQGDELTEAGAVVVVAFGTAGSDSRYVHRVDEVLDDGAWLRGDNNADRDPQPVTQDQVLGTPRFALTGVSADLFTASQTLVGRVVAAAVAVVLLCVPASRQVASRGGDTRNRSTVDEPATTA
jgi:signal peptidase